MLQIRSRETGRFGNSLVLPRRIVVLPICRAQWLCCGLQLLFELVTQEVWVQFPILLWVSQGFGMSFSWQCLRLRGLEKVEEFLSLCLESWSALHAAAMQIILSERLFLNPARTATSWPLVLPTIPFLS